MLDVGLGSTLWRHPTHIHLLAEYLDLLESSKKGCVQGLEAQPLSQPPFFYCCIRLRERVIMSLGPLPSRHKDFMVSLGLIRRPWHFCLWRNSLCRNVQVQTHHQKNQKKKPNKHKRLILDRTENQKYPISNCICRRQSAMGHSQSQARCVGLWVV